MKHTSPDSALSLEAVLLKAVESDVPGVQAAAQHLLHAGGKRIRPRFTALLGEALESSPDTALVIGNAAELVHTATLLHDDVIDRSERRRGKPTVHIRYGTRTAVLTGDFLLATALQTLTSQGLFAATHELTVAMREVVEAEILQAEQAFSTQTTVRQTRRIAEGKTGALFAWCARSLVLSLGRPQPHVTAADRIGRMIGYAFQVADDLLDVAPEDPGKPIRKDLLEGQLTIPVQLARADDEALDAAISRAFTSRRAEDFTAAYSALEQSRARQRGHRELLDCRQQILALWQGVDPRPESRAALSAFLDEWIPEP